MPVYHGIKTILVTVPKTASTSVSTGLHYINTAKGGISQSNAKHEGICDIKRYLSKNYFDSYYKIAFVRNPWDWTVSLYFYYKSLNKIKGIKKDLSDLSFKDFIPLIKTFNKECSGFGPNLSQAKHPYQPQYKYLVDENENLIVDYVGKYERIDDDWDNLLGQTKGLTQDYSLPRMNIGGHDHYTTYYTNELREMVGGLYAKDIELFDYKF